MLATATVTVRVDAMTWIRAADVPSEVRRAIREELTLPNPAYVAAVRQGRFAGYLPRTVSLYGREGDFLVLPRGYTPRAVARLRQAGVQVRFEDRRLVLPEVALRFTGRLLPYQTRAVRAAHTSGILCGPPGCGKTVMGLAVAAAVRQPTLWLTHTRDLANQAAERAVQFLGLRAEEVGRIGDGRWHPRDPFTVALVQTLINRTRATQELAQRIGLLVVDEAHHTPAITFLQVVGMFPAARRLGLTATPDRADGLWPFAEAAIGPVLYRITPQELEAAGRLVRPRLIWVLTRFEAPFDGDWNGLLDALTTDPDRNHLICRRVAQEATAGHRCLVLSERVAHCTALAAQLRRFLPPEQVAVLTGDQPTGQRMAALAGLRTGRVRVLLATKLADEGLDLPALDRLFVVAPRRATARVLQQAGRLMRPAPGKGQPVLFDFRDRRVGVLEAQARARWLGVYRGLVSDERWEPADEVWLNR